MTPIFGDLLGLLFTLFLIHSSFVVAASRYRLNTVRFTDNEYEVKLLNNPIAQLSGDSIQLYSKYGQRFSCKFPKLSANESETTNDITMASLNAVLGHLESQCLLLVNGWWTYEFCYRRNITQFHVDEHNPPERLAETILGYFSSETNWDSKDQALSARSYHSQNYTDGDICDITFKPRVAEVRFVCLPGKSATIIDINEVETCIYLIEIGVPSLCAYSKFKPRETSPAPAKILCHPLVTAEELTDFQSGDPSVRRPVHETKRSTDNGHRRSDDRVRTLWYTRSRLLSRRQHRTHLQVIKLAQRLYRVLQRRVVSEPSLRSNYVAISHFIREILLSGKPVSLKVYLWHYQLMRLHDGMLDLITAVELWNDRSFVDNTRVSGLLLDIGGAIQKESGLIIQQANGVVKVSNVPVYNMLEAITLYNAVVKLTITVTDTRELQKLFVNLKTTRSLLHAAGDRRNAVILLPNQPGFKQSLVSAESLQLLQANLQIQLTIMKLQILESEKELSYRRFEKHIEHSVSNMLTDLKGRVLVVQQPSRSSPNPSLVNNPYQYPRRKPSPRRPAVDDDSVDPEDMPTTNSQEAGNEDAWASIIEKVFQKVFPGVSIFQAPTKPGSSETLYIYSSVEKGKENKRSNRQEAAYRFTVKGTGKRRDGDTSEP